MKHIPSTVLASLLASVIVASVAPAFAAQGADQPQCGDEKKGGEEKKPKSPSGL